jgi:hypothetical protein
MSTNFWPFSVGGIFYRPPYRHTDQKNLSLADHHNFLKHSYVSRPRIDDSIIVTVISFKTTKL